MKKRNIFGSVEKIGKCLHKILSFAKFKFELKLKLFFAGKKKKIFMLATPVHGNLGDQAIVLAEKQMLIKNGYNKKQIIEIRDPDYRRFKDYLRGYINTNDLIIVDGGGNLGTLWENEDDKISDIISTFGDNKIVIFPQTCYYDDTEEAKKRLKKNRETYRKSNLSVFLRDKASYDFCIKHFECCNIYLCPDIALFLSKETILGSKKTNRDGVLLCFRGDLEKITNYTKSIEKQLGKNNLSHKNTSTLVTKYVGNQNRKKEVAKKLLEFSKAKLVITDRLHAMIFSALAGTPCIAFDSVSKKVSGVYEWIKDLNYVKCVSDIDNLDKTIFLMIKKDDNKYILNEKLFKQLEDSLKLN